MSYCDSIHFFQQSAIRSCTALKIVQGKSSNLVRLLYLKWLQCRRPESCSTSLVTFIFIHREQLSLCTCSTLCFLPIFDCVRSEGHRCQSQLLLEWQQTDWQLIQCRVLFPRDSLLITWPAVLNLFLGLPSFEPRQPIDVTHKGYSRSSPKHFLWIFIAYFTT